MAITSTMSARLGSFQMAQKNGETALAMMDLAEASYAAIADMIAQMRDLAVAASSDHLTGTERDQLETVIGEMVDEIDRVANTAEYNGIKLLDGTGGDGGKVVFFVGIDDSNDSIIRHRFRKSDAASLNLDTASVATQSRAQITLGRLDEALETLHDKRFDLNGVHARTRRAIDTLVDTVATTGDGLGGIQDLDMGAESARFAQEQIRQQAGVAMLTQSNALANMALRLIG